MRLCRLAAAVLLAALNTPGAESATLQGTIVDAGTGKPVAARIYIESEAGEWFFARSAESAGSAVTYEKRRPPSSVEIHTTLSAHPFAADLAPGRYTVTVERGKEYLPHSQTVSLPAGGKKLRIALKRWVDMSSHGWYSGETHVHRDQKDLPTLMTAEDLNVAFPLSQWVRKAFDSPAQGDLTSGDATAELRVIDPLHVFYPLNTEYEIATVGAERHILGAVFAINHREPLTLGAPPVKPIAAEVKRQGGLLELDKHNWPWSMMLVPVMDVDLYELTNNHIWRTEFAFKSFGDTGADYMKIESDQEGFTERGWIDFTFQNYYALLNCGFRLRPTGGTASGVHPVPFGFGRVYVKIDGRFSYDKWVAGLDAGRSFVTTGPMLDVHLNDGLPGGKFPQESSTAAYRLEGSVRSATPLSTIEVISAGEVIKTIEPENKKEAAGGFVSAVNTAIEVSESTWIALRAFAPAGEGRARFAHGAPFFIEVAGKPLRPRRAEVNYLIKRVEDEIERNTGVLPEEAIAEYREALAAYQAIAQTAR